MGKKRIAKKGGGGVDQDLKNRSLSKIPKRKIEKAKVYIQASYNNTMITLTDENGNTFIWSSAGAIGFRGARKGTPYAASKVVELIVEKARMIGVGTVEIFVKGVGGGRESAIRSLVGSGMDIEAIRDITPIPHNGPKAPKVRRV